jgi:polyisoprenoid-binding protein YceI
MKRLALGLIGLFLIACTPATAAPQPTSTNPADAPAGVYVLDKSHASLTAKVSHMGLSLFTLRFDSLDARYDYDPAAPESTKLSVTVDAGSMDVGDPKLGARFAKEFLGADRYPQISFVSTGIQRIDANHGLVAGDLTLNGVTKPVSLDVTFNGCGPGLLGFGGYRMGYSAVADIKRSDFDSKAWQSLVGDDVHLLIEVEFARQ